MASPVDYSKAALNIWCGKKKLKITYDIVQEPQQQDGASIQFRCEITIDTISYTATAIGPSKKAASNQAALAMLTWLVSGRYITKIDLSESCYTSLKIHEVLFPGGVPVSCPDAPPAPVPPVVNRPEPPSLFPPAHPLPPPFFGSDEHEPNFYSNIGPPPPRPSLLGPGPRGPPPPHDFDYGQPPPLMPPPHDDFGPPNPYGPPMGPPPNGYHYDQPPSMDDFNYGRPPIGPNAGYEPLPNAGHFGPPPPPMHHQPQQQHYSRRPPAIPEADPYDPIFWQHSEILGGGDDGNNNGPRDWQIDREFDDRQHMDMYQQRQPPSAPVRQEQEVPIEEAIPLVPPPSEGNSSSNGRKRKTIDYSKPHGASSSAAVEAAAVSVGGYNLDNAKQQLHQFMQINRIKADYEYSSFGPAHALRFTAKLKLFVRHLGRELCVTEEGPSKMDASRQCALTILKQLYQEGLIDTFQADAPSKRQLLRMNLIYEIDVTPHLKSIMTGAYSIVQSYNSQINPGSSTGIFPVGMPSYFNPLAAQLNAKGPGANGVMESPPNYLFWCGPLPDYNPWTNTKPDDAIFPGKSPEEVNNILQAQFQSMIKDTKFQSILSSRMKLPIYCIKEQVISLIDRHSVLIIKGSTGCGKTTQVPQFILDSALKSGNGSQCNIVVTQPRRISAISIAERVAYERGEALFPGKSSVGYSVRFDHIYPRPYGSILFCTTGHLLRRIQGGLKGVSHLIIDEVHERDINTDLLLVIVRDLIGMGLELKVVIMSATIGVGRFQEYFNNCHVLEIEGTLFPVQRYFLEDTIELINWRPGKLSYMEDDADVLAANMFNTEGERLAAPMEEQLLTFEVEKKYSSHTVELMRRLREGVICFELIVAILEYIERDTVTGAVLIFLPGWAAIFELLEFLKKHPTFGDESRFLLLPLHSQLAYKDNHRVFNRVPQRKIILSTNIAETSITIDDVVFVIDTCLLKRKVYCSRTNVSSFLVDWVSKANIQQRQGRAGRVRSGYFFALCSRRRFCQLEDYKIPEMLVTSLVETALLIKYLGFGNVPDFLAKCLDRPTARSVQEALATLRAINCFDEHDQLTPLGTVLVKLPIDPRLGRMVMLALLLGVAGPALTIAAASATQHELFETGAGNAEAIGRLLLRLDENHLSDHLIQFKVFHLYERQQNLHEYRDYLNVNAIFHVQNARKQLANTLIHLGFPPEAFTSKATYTTFELDSVIGCLVTAFYPNICLHKESRRILTNEERVGLIHKSSVLYAYVAEGRLTKPTSLQSPLFVYSEKSANRHLITSKSMSMVNFMQLLLFGVRRYEFPVPPPGASPTSCDTILLDGWLEIRIDPQVFDCVWLIKTELENILTRVCYHPPSLNVLNHIETTILDAVRNMCSMENSNVEIRVNKDKPPLLANV